MPIYVYEPAGNEACAHCEQGFEMLQKLNDDALTQCVECANPVRRVVTAANITASSPSLSESNIAKHGLTQYRKLEKGVYEKTAGKGPDLINGDSKK